MIKDWFDLSIEVAKLAAEAQHVIGTRVASFAFGRGTHAEASLMVTEKLAAFQEAALTLAVGGSPRAVVRGYRKKVRANARRLRRH